MRSPDIVICDEFPKPVTKGEFTELVERSKTKSKIEMVRPRKWGVYRLVAPQDGYGRFGVLDRQQFKGQLYVVTEVSKGGLGWVELRRCADGKEVIGQYRVSNFFEQFEEVI